MPPTRRRLPLFACASILAAAVLGCGRDGAEVSGRVTHAGKPLPGGSVILYCADGQIVRGIVGADGTYTIPNVPRGPATVTVQAHAPVPSGLRQRQNLPPSVDGPTPPATGGKSVETAVIPSRYGVPEESGLSVVVDRSRVTYDIDLKP